MPAPSTTGLSKSERWAIYMPYLTPRSANDDGSPWKKPGYKRLQKMVLKDRGHDISINTVKKDLREIRDGRLPVPSAAHKEHQGRRTPSAPIVAVGPSGPLDVRPLSAPIASPQVPPRAMMHPHGPPSTVMLRPLGGTHNLNWRGSHDDAAVIALTLIQQTLGQVDCKNDSECPGCGVVHPCGGRIVVSTGDVETLDAVKAFSRMYSVDAGIARMDMQRQTVVIEQDITKFTDQQILAEVHRRDPQLWAALVDLMTDLGNAQRTVTVDGEQVGT